MKYLLKRNVFRNYADTNIIPRFPEARTRHDAVSTIFVSLSIARADISFRTYLVFRSL